LHVASPVDDEADEDVADIEYPERNDSGAVARPTRFDGALVEFRCG
jgi:hypothetical protein